MKTDARRYLAVMVTLIYSDDRLPDTHPTTVLMTWQTTLPAVDDGKGDLMD